MLQHSAPVYGLTLVAALVLLMAGNITAQDASIRSNSISHMVTDGPVIRVSPFLDYATEGLSWANPQIDSLTGTSNRVFSLSEDGSMVCAGLGRTDNLGPTGSITTGVGLLVSENDGISFTFKRLPIDLPRDTVVQAPWSAPFRAVPVLTLQDSPPWDVDCRADGSVWLALGKAGLRYSPDAGTSWIRVPLPPDTMDVVDTGVPQPYVLDYRADRGGWYNLDVFSVLHPSTDEIWAGTQAGINISTDGGRNWRRSAWNSEGTGLTGSWVVSIARQPATGTVWLATWPSDSGTELSTYGATFTTDGGETWHQTLVGETIIDFAFRADTVYAAGRSRGLFVSTDGGATWVREERFAGALVDRTLEPVQPDVLSVAVTPDNLWVGTDQGLFRQAATGGTWEAVRARVPLQSVDPQAGIRNVDTYAYPNPYSPTADGALRVRYRNAGGAATVRIYDFGMNLVREITGPESDAGQDLEVVWNGLDSRGARIANGPYLYEVRSGAERYRGKILVLQ